MKNVKEYENANANVKRKAFVTCCAYAVWPVPRYTFPVARREATLALVVVIRFILQVIKYLLYNLWIFHSPPESTAHCGKLTSNETKCPLLLRLSYHFGLLCTQREGVRQATPTTQQQTTLVQQQTTH